jgi:hypothetical protein
MALLSHIPRVSYSAVRLISSCSVQRAHNDEESNSDTLGKADAERRRCRDWLLPFMKNNQPKFLTNLLLKGLGGLIV